MRRRWEKRLIAMLLCLVLCLGDNAAITSLAAQLPGVEAPSDETVSEEVSTEEVTSQETVVSEEASEIYSEETSEEVTEEVSVSEAEEPASVIEETSEDMGEVASEDFGDGIDLSTLDIQVGGHISVDDDLDVGHISDIPDEMMAPSYGELEEKYITSGLPAVKNQRKAGICWSESVTGTAEISLIKDGFSSVDTSEAHFAFFGTNHANDPLGNTPLEENFDVENHSKYLTSGGHETFSALGLANWKGLADESILPIDNFNLGDVDAVHEIENNGLPLAFEDGNPSRYADIEDAEAVRAMAYNDTYYLLESKMGDINNEPDYVKSLIKKYGAVTGSYYQDNQGKRIYNYYKSDTRTKSLLTVGNTDYEHSVVNCYYNPDITYTQNHAIVIVGWDDNYPKENFIEQPEHDGAWLIRNSWGVDEEYGEDYISSYFWISYDEPSIQNEVVALELTNERPYDNNYFYDGFTGMQLAKNGSVAVPMFSYAGSRIFATEFKANGGEDGKANEVIKAVSFNTGSAALKYKLQVYVDTTEGDPTSGSLALIQYGELTEAGTRVIDLDEDVLVEHGKNFSVVIDFSDTDDSAYKGIYLEKNKDARGKNVCEGHSYIFEDGELSESDCDTSIKVLTDNSAETVPAVDIPGDFIMDEDGVTLIGYAGTDTNITIPYGVEVINDEVFKNKSIASVSFPQSLKKIGVGAFYGNTTLGSVTIPSGVTQIGRAAFGGCTGLTSVDIKSYELEISDITNNRGAILKYYPNGSNNNPVISNAGPFVGDANLNTVTYNMTVIPDYFMLGCSGITSFTINDNVKEIGECAFFHADNLATVAISDDSSLKKIGYAAFWGEKKLSSINLPEGLEAIDNVAFVNCTSLTDIKLPSTLESLGTGAFSACTGLTKINIPKNLTVNYNSNEIGPDNSNGNYQNIGPFGIVKNNGSVGNTSFTEIEFEDGITEIPDYLFSGYMGSADIIIPDTVTTIGMYAFRSINNVEKLYIPASVTKIEEEKTNKFATITSTNENFSIYGIYDTYAQEYASEAEIRFNGAKIEFTVESLELAYNDLANLNEMITREGVDELASITMTVDDDAVAIFTAPGVIKAVGGGAATVTATVDGIGAIATIDIVVKAYMDAECISIELGTSDDDDSYAYTGKAVKPAVTVKDGERLLTIGTDYTLTYSNNIALGNNATVTITGKGYYQGAVDKKYSIKYDLAKATTTVSFDGKNYTPYTNTAIVPTSDNITVKIGNTTIAKESIKTAAVPEYNNIMAGTAIVRVLPADSATDTIMGYKDVAFVIKGIDISKTANVTITAPKKAVWSGTSETTIDSLVVLHDVKNDRDLELDTDYKLVYTNNAAPGTAKVMISGIGAYSGSKELAFAITKPSFADAKLKSDDPAKNAGHIVIDYSIAPKEYSGRAIALESTDILDVSYNGQPLVAGVDYKITYANNTNVNEGSDSKARVILTGKGKYAGKYNKTDEDAIFYDITFMSSSTFKRRVKATVSDMKYTGSECKPGFSAALYDDAGKLVRKLKAGKDYSNEYGYFHNVDVSDADPSIRVVFRGNLANGVAKDYGFRIYPATAKNISHKSIKVSVEPVAYDGNSYSFDDVITIKDGADKTLRNAIDFDIIESDDTYTNAGKHSFIIVGKGDYFGRRTINFNIGKKLIVLSSAERQGNLSFKMLDRLWFTGYAYKPVDEIQIIDNELGVGLVEGVDYKYTSYNSTKPGMVGLKMKFIGNYEFPGTVQLNTYYQTFPVRGNNITVTYDDTFYNNGKAVNPKNLKISKYGKPINPKLFNITYSDNKSVTDSAMITLTPKANMFSSTDPVIFTYEIKAVDVSNLKVGKITAQTYKGVPIMPSPVVKYGNKKLVRGVDYEVAYSNNNEKGKATITITGIGNFTGTRDIEFIIK